jgi:hypothetical protein
MDFAVNYSREAEDLVRRGHARIDCFKCPAWPDLVAAVKARYPVYAHFPLQVGSGIGDATADGEPADWASVDGLRAESATRIVNIHLGLNHAVGSNGATETGQSGHGSAGSDAETLVENLIRDVSAVVERLGTDQVAIENDHDFGGRRPPGAIMPQVMRRVVKAAGCGLVLDLAHARLVAGSLGLEARDCVDALPTHRLRELHVSGVQRLEGRWLASVRQGADDITPLARLCGQPLDHLPMTEPDWEPLGWVAGNIYNGAWPQPWAVTLEFGGTGPLFSALTDADSLAEQMPRVRAMARGGQSEDLRQQVWGDAEGEPDRDAAPPGRRLGESI